MRLFRPWLIMRCLYPGAVFRLETTEKLLCLTFDDGPDPSSTPELLKILDGFRIRAVFFCDGRKAEQYPFLVERIKREGHITGNHGYSHINGWFTSVRKYCSDIKRASPFTSESLFRPPYGKIRLRQYIRLKKQFRIFFWDLMPYDFDNNMGYKKSLDILSRKIRPGSIIVLHDNPSSSVLQLVHDLINIAQSRGYSFIIPQVD
jgi:peptidoglycan/xylan/chitin deacetylase (PgdA/CDA1 family)